MDNYEILSEFDKLYKQLAKLWHPDHNPERADLATRRMQRLNAFYQSRRDAFVQWLEGMGNHVHP